MRTLCDEGRTERFFMASFAVYADGRQTDSHTDRRWLRFFFSQVRSALSAFAAAEAFFFFGAPARRGAAVRGGVVKCGKDAPFAAQMRILGLGSIKARKRVHVHV